MQYLILFDPPEHLMVYTVFLKHVASGDLFQLPLDTLNCVEELNKGSNCTFTFDYSLLHDQVALPYSTTVKTLFTSVFSEIWYQDSNANILWLGVVSDAQVTKDATGAYTLTVAAVDYFGLLQKRRTDADKVYTGVDPASIPWTEINASQSKTSGNLGITVGVTASTGITVNEEYKREDLNQLISDLSNLKLNNSFDFDIDVTKKFNVYYPTKGSLRSNVVFDNFTIASWGIDTPLLLSMTNSVYARGSGVNTDVPETNSIASSGVVAEYTLLEDIITDTQTSDTGVLQAEGDKYLALYELSLDNIEIIHTDEVDLTTYDVGDTVIVNIPEWDISYAQYRVKKRTVQIDDTGTMTSTIDLLTM